VQGQSCTSVCSIAQAASVAALNGPQDQVAVFREAFQRRRDLVVAGIAKQQALNLDAPDGAFYAYIGCAGVIGARTPAGKVLETDIDVVQYLLDEGHVSSVPGTAYGLSPYFRISTATSDAVLTEAVARINRAVSALTFS
jgi:aspartate aminotransferase